MPVAVDLNAFLRKHFPLAAALDIRVIEDGDRFEVRAPFEPNRNHMSTAFGGSLSAILILACYGWAFKTLQANRISGHVVLKRSEIDFFKPLKSEICAVCEPPTAEDLQKFLDQLKRKGKARITLTSKVKSNQGDHCRLEGEFVAILEN